MRDALFTLAGYLCAAAICLAPVAFLLHYVNNLPLSGVAG